MLMLTKMKELKKTIKVLLFVFVPLWFMFAPLGLLMYVLLLPFGQAKRRDRTKQEVVAKVVGNPKSEKEIVFVHGWPDSGDLWNRMLPYFKEYRCIVLTMPCCDAGLPCDGYGFCFSQITLSITQCVEMHRKNMDVKPTWIAHDWGCWHTYNVYKVRPDLVKRMACLDVGPDADMTLSMAFFCFAYVNSVFFPSRENNDEQSIPSPAGIKCLIFFVGFLEMPELTR